MHSPAGYRVHEFDSAAILAQEACRYILETAEQAISARGVFRIVLAGGNTPRDIYRVLADARTDWPAWHAYFGDERCLAADDPERNSAMARSTLLDHVAISRAQIHVIDAELGAEEAAARYAQELASVGEFDLVLLGLGEDGHTASLFPGKDWGEADNAPAAIPVHGAPKMPPDRVSLSARRLSLARSVMFIVSGKPKLDAVRRLLAGERVPASAIRIGPGIDIYTDLHLQDATVSTRGKYA
jgi:6-phosphogluconolactonase